VEEVTGAWKKAV